MNDLKNLSVLRPVGVKIAKLPIYVECGVTDRDTSYKFIEWLMLLVLWLKVGMDWGCLIDGWLVTAFISILPKMLVAIYCETGSTDSVVLINIILKSYLAYVFVF